MRLGRCQIHKGFHGKDVPALAISLQLCPSVLLKGRNSKGIYMDLSSLQLDPVSIWKKTYLCKWAIIGVYLTWIVYGCSFFFFFYNFVCLFSVWCTFPCYLLHFGAKTSTLLNVGAKICNLHCSSIFPWFYMIFPWCSLIYPKCSSILNSVHWVFHGYNCFFPWFQLIFPCITCTWWTCRI